ncbi:MAG: PAS domain S-box protein [Myxococcales bacterium]|nr:PAS domain S-box protein [Myxococcales bacterium]
MRAITTEQREAWLVVLADDAMASSWVTAVEALGHHAEACAGLDAVCAALAGGARWAVFGSAGRESAVLAALDRLGTLACRVWLVDLESEGLSAEEALVAGAAGLLRSVTPDGLARVLARRATMRPDAPQPDPSSGARGAFDLKAVTRGQLPVPAWVATREGTVLAANAAFLRCHGVDSLTGLGAYRVFEANDAAVLGLSRDAPTVDRERVIETVFGGRVALQERLILAQHDPDRVVGYWSDLGMPGRELTPHESLSTWLSMAEQAAEAGHWSYDLNTGQLSLSATARALLGVDGELMARGPEAWLEGVATGSWERVQSACFAGTEVTRSEVEFEHRRPDGLRRTLVAQGLLVGAVSPQRLGILRDVTGRRRGAEMRAMELDVLRRVSSGEPLDAVLRLTLEALERVFPGGIASVHRVEASGARFGQVVAPGLPSAYLDAIASVGVGPDEGSCGTAVWRRSSVIVSDIAADPLWLRYRDVALAHGLRACWSTPVIDTDGEMVASFALYFREPRAPVGDDVRWIERAAHLVRLALQRDRRFEAMRRVHESVQSVFESAPMAMLLLTEGGEVLEANAMCAQLLESSPEALKRRGFGAYLSDDARHRWEQVIEALGAGELSQAALEVWVATLGGRRQVCRVHLNRLESAGAGRRLLAAIEDLAELRRVEHERTSLSRKIAAPAVRGPIGDDPAPAGGARQLGAHNEALLRLASRVTRLGAWSYTAKEGLELSPEVSEILELSMGYEVESSHLLERVGPSYRAPLMALSTAAWVDGRPFDIELELTSPRGRSRWVRCIAEAVVNAHGEVESLQGVLKDLTDQRDTQASLAVSQRRFQNLADAMPLIVWTATGDGLVDFVNRHIAPNPEQPDERPEARWQGAIDPEDRLRAQSAWRHAVLTGEGFHERLRISRGSGPRRWHQVVAVRIGEVAQELRWYGTATDVDDVVRLEEETRRLARRLSTTLESITDAFFILDRSWRFSFVNTEFEKLLRRGRDVLVGGEIWAHFPELEGTALERLFRRAVRDAETVRLEFFYPRHERWFELRGYPSDEGLAVYLHDVTQRRRDEQTLREQATLLDKAQDAIVVTDLEQHITFWNAGAERLYGWRRDQAMGRRFAEMVYSQELAPRGGDRFEQTLQQGYWTGELGQRTQSGERKVVNSRWTLLRAERDEPREFLIINTDVTQQKNTEAQLLRAQRLESIGTLAGGIAHDLNNVLAPILFSIEMLRSDETRAGRLEDLATLEMCAERGAEMVRQLLAFARGHHEGARARVDLGAVVGDVVKLIRETFPKDVVLGFERLGRQWSVNGNVTQLHQLIMNLSVNARDAMPLGGRLHFTVSAVDVDEVFAGMNLEAHPGPHMLLEVEDTGTGMPREVIDRIFDPFFTTKEIGKGTGLGLSTCLAIVRGHGGFLNVYSEVGKGTRFRVYLPAERPTTGRIDLVASPTRSLPEGRGELLLVVDDEESIRRIAQRTLERYGYRVITASNGAEAVSLFARNHSEIAVVITDMSMPVMDGPATIIALHALDPEVKIIASSGIEPTARGALSGVAAFVAKPYTAETLLGALRALLDPR